MPAQLYDWDSLFKSAKFVLQFDIDYICSQAALVQQVRNRAVQRGIKVSIKDNGDSVEVTVVSRANRKNAINS